MNKLLNQAETVNLYDISIIIPIYNVQDYIVETLESVIDQTEKCNIECILIDDCGKDASVILAEQFIDHYNGAIDFRIIHHERNRGLSAARNTGIQKSAGEYLLFLDGDDKLYPESLQLLWELREKYNQVDAVKGDFIIEGVTNSIINKNFPSISKDLKWIRTNMCNLSIPESACNCLVRRDLILKNNIFFKEGWIQEDTLWTFKLQRHIKSIAFCFEPTYFYRLNHTSIMHTMDKQREANAYSLIFNEAYHDMLLGDIELYELAYLEKMAERIYNAVGKDGLKLICTKDNILFSTLFKLNRKINSIRFLPIIKSLRLVIKIIRCLLQNKKIFVYKVYTR